MTRAVTVLQEHVRHCAGGVSSSGLSWLPGPGNSFYFAWRELGDVWNMCLDTQCYVGV